MFTPPANWNKLTPTERREARFAAWMSTEGKPMATPEALATYKAHTQRVKDIVDLKKPDRVLTPAENLVRLRQYHRPYPVLCLERRKTVLYPSKYLFQSVSASKPYLLQPDPQ